MAYAHTHAANPHWLPVNDKATTNHIPGEDGLPFFGKTFEQLKDPLAFQRKMVAKHGPIYRIHSFGGRFVQLLGPEAISSNLLSMLIFFRNIFAEFSQLDKYLLDLTPQK
jgi:hypothetical protein